MTAPALLQGLRDLAPLGSLLALVLAGGWAVARRARPKLRALRVVDALALGAVLLTVALHGAAVLAAREQARAIGAQLEAARRPSPDRSDRFAALEALGDALDRATPASKGPTLSQWWLGVVAPGVQRDAELFYSERVGAELEAPWRRRLEETLAGSSDDAARRTALKAYLALSEPRLFDPASWTSGQGGNAGTSAEARWDLPPGRDVDSTDTPVEARLLARLLSLEARGRTSPPPANATLVESARARLAALPSARYLYASLVEPAPETPPFGLDALRRASTRPGLLWSARSAIGGGSADVEARYRLESQRLISARLRAANDVLAREAWVVPAVSVRPSFRDLTSVAAAYEERRAQAWSVLLDDLRIERPATCEEALGMISWSGSGGFEGLFGALAAEVGPPVTAGPYEWAATSSRSPLLERLAAFGGRLDQTTPDKQPPLRRYEAIASRVAVELGELRRRGDGLETRHAAAALAAAASEVEQLVSARPEDERRVLCRLLLSPFRVADGRDEPTSGGPCELESP